jgi:hypothetical protein
MQPKDLKMMQQLFCGQVLRHNEVHSTGVRIKSLDYDKSNDNLVMSVYYLNLSASEGDMYYSDRDVLVLGFNEFLRQFSYNKNSHIGDLKQADWIELTRIVEAR